jgi:hypothetical protein
MKTSSLIHHSMTFCIAVVLCLAAIAIYVWSDDLWAPPPKPTLPKLFVAAA